MIGVLLVYFSVRDFLGGRGILFFSVDPLLAHVRKWTILDTYGCFSPETKWGVKMATKIPHKSGSPALFWVLFGA